MGKITKDTNLLQYPLLILKFTEKYGGKKVPMDEEHCNEIWDSLTEEEKATNKDYTVEWDDGWKTQMVIRKNGEVVKIIKLA